MKATCPDDFETEIKESVSWHKLPLSENLNLIMYGGSLNETYYGYELANEAGIPKIENGYYVFVDKHKKSKDIYSDKDLFNRASFNFIVALYDEESNSFYYYEFDT